MVKHKHNDSFPEKPYIHLYGQLWSDGYDSNNCKRARGVSWIQTLTILSTYLFQSGNGEEPLVLMHNGEEITYVYCMGHDSERVSDRNLSQHSLVQELDNLHNGIHDKFTLNEDTTFISVYLSLLCYIADQPERRSLNGLMQGNSNYHGRWGVLYDHNTNINSLLPCKKCRKLLST